VTTWTMPPLSVDADVLELARVYRFRAMYPDVIVLRSFPAAWIGRRKIEAPSVGLLLDKLELIMAPSG